MPGSTAAGRSIRPGAVTQLLADLIRAPRGAGWDSPLLPGDHVGRFEILGELGRGGFGVVYQARDHDLGRDVAFKAVRPSHADPLADARRLGEAEAAARLAHPNIVHLYDVGRCDQGAYLILELLRGRPLSEWTGQPVALRDAVRVALDIARGLAHAHAHGVVHRDLKPANVFVCDDGQVKVLDFGLAHVFGRPALDGGTPAYMAPEQARGEIGDERSDLFSLGVILDELLPKERPGALARLVTRLRSEDPAARPASAAEVEAELARVQRTLQPRRLFWTAWAVAALAVASAVVVGLRTRPLPPGRLLVGIADTANASGDADLDALTQWLGTGLEASQRLSIVARSRLLAAMPHDVGARPTQIDERAARAVAVPLRLQAVIVPAVRRSGAGYDLDFTAIDVNRGETAFTIHEHAAGRGAVPGAVDRLVERAREAFHEPAAPRAESAVQLANVLPVNSEAWRHYAEGQRLDSEFRTDEALQAYERALQADPDFPLAHVRLADKAWPENPQAVATHLQAALHHLARLPPKDRELAEARKAFLELRHADAFARYDRVIAAWPEDPAAWVAAADHAMYFGGRSLARPYMEKAVAIAAVGVGDSIDYLLELGRTDEALERARRWAETPPRHLTLRMLAKVEAWRGDAAAALATRRRAIALDPQSQRPRGTDFWFYLNAEAEDEAEQLFLRAGVNPWPWRAIRGERRAALAAFDAAAPPPSNAVGGHHVARGDLLWGDGDADAIWREAQRALEQGAFAANCLRAPLAYLGDLARAARLHTLWPGSDPRDYCVRNYLLLKAWRTGDAETAMRGFEDTFGGMSRYHRAEILRDMGRHREAVEAFRWFRVWPSWGSVPAATWAYPRSLYLEALSLEQLGEREQALRTVERLLRLWRRADPDLPYLREAKALRDRLARGS